ncbi:MAG: hypothetical protein RL272_1331, partial [Candidatus Parcubacteria bacterium]
MTGRIRKTDVPEIAVVAALLVLCGAGTWLYNVVLGYADVQYVWLADAFLRGRLDIPFELLQRTSFMDTVLRGGRYYWPLGPLPAVLFMPAVAVFGQQRLVQGVGQAAFAVCAFALAYALARRERFSWLDAAWLATAFCFGSIVIGVIDIGMPWHIANLLTVAGMLGALVEWKGCNRPVAVGAWLAFAVAARPQAAVVAVFFFLHDVIKAGFRPPAIRRLALMAAPLALMAALLGAYNAARFGSPFDTGQR